jgi:hypothetical protein
MDRNPPHSRAVPVILKWLTGLLGIRFVRWQLSIGSSIEDRERSEPEADLVVLREAVSGTFGTTMRLQSSSKALRCGSQKFSSDQMLLFASETMSSTRIVSFTT